MLERVKALLLDKLGSKITTDEIDKLSLEVADEISTEPERSIPLVNTSSKEIEWVPLNTILFLEQPKDIMMFYTRSIVYERLTCSKGSGNFDRFLAQYGFIPTHKRQYVNMRLAKKYDSYYMRVYFDENATHETKLYVTVSGDCIKGNISKALGKENDINTQVGIYSSKLSFPKKRSDVLI
ncbi:hypothetical protein [Paenibacillus cremeus]|uniref:Uncharacterized protein n=1 Tax=Paenibacillus cremeus TaxID=2163881 RepID=A0A559KCP5_9BACL|nr:hypothetical protein [Paenibacillus cremeus]TVY09894.1 hypothetical protein FPZ49_11015 [Paenibacillus cremeus]